MYLISCDLLFMKNILCYNFMWTYSFIIYNFHTRIKCIGTYI